MKRHINLLGFIFCLVLIIHPATAYPNHWEGKTMRSQLWKTEPAEMEGVVIGEKLEKIFPISGKDLNFTYKYNMSKGGFEFSRSLTADEELVFYDIIFDDYQVQNFDDLIRFDRSVHEANANLDPNQKIPLIESKLRECIAVVGKEQNDWFYINSKGDPAWSERSPHDIDPVLIKRTTPVYLSKFMAKCVRYIYPQIQKGRFYNIGDFEFNIIKTPEQQQLENLYEEIYLEVMKAGLRRRMLSTFYPKSFLREHAKKTGLYQYILKQEKRKTRLTHDELAANYFGSYVKWLRSLEQFIATKF